MEKIDKIRLVALLCGVIFIFGNSFAAAGGHPENARYSPDHNVSYFLAISDTHIGQEASAEGNLENLLGHTRNIIRPDFIINAGDLTDNVCENDLDCRDIIEGHVDQWYRYRSIVRTAGMTNKIYSEVPGNHDNYREDEDTPLHYYRTLSTQGLATKGKTQRQWWPKKGYQFVMVDTNDQSINHWYDDMDWTFSLDPICMPDVFDSRCQPAKIDDTEISEIQEWLKVDSSLIFVVGHHGINNILPLKRREEFLSHLKDNKVSMYIYGHTHQHGAWMREGTLHLNVDSLYEHSLYTLVAIDNDGVSVVNAALDQWPIVLITAPTDKKLGGNNPYAYSVPADAKNPIRALVFNDQNYCTISSVKMFIKGTGDWEEIGGMDRVSSNPKDKTYNLWEGFWNAIGIAPGEYQIGGWAECTLPSPYFPPPVAIGGNSITVNVIEPTNHAPVAGLNMTAKEKAAYENQTLSLIAGAKEKIKIAFSGARSADPDPGDSIIYYQWFINGKSASKKKSFSKTLAAGTYAIYLEVKDTKGAQGSVGASITIAADGNVPPEPPTLLSQFRTDGTTAIPAGGETNENAVILKGTISDPDGGQVKLQVELRKTSEEFTGVPNYESSFLDTSTTATITLSGLANGQYQWRAKAADQKGGTSAWIDAGEGGPDFIVKLSSNLPPSINDMTADPMAVLINEVSIISVSVSDHENDPITYLWSANGGSLSASSGPGPITWTAPDNPGIFTITVSVADDRPWHDLVLNSVGITVIKPPIGIISLSKTGQTVCHDAGGNIIDCAGTGQDGEIQAGVEWPDPRFTNLDGLTPLSEGEVLDQLTGLVWMRDAGVPTLGSCEGGRRTWEEALNYVACLNSINYLGHNDWRLPNVNELESLANAGETDSAEWLNSQGFFNAQSNGYFSSTPAEMNIDLTFLIVADDGTIAHGLKSNKWFVWPVRSGQSDNPNSLYPANIWKTGKKTSHASGDDGDLQRGVTWPTNRFIDHGDETITDAMTGLMWLKNSDLAGETKTWQEAIDFVKSLNNETGLAGYHDWRLPNKKEIFSLMDHSIIFSWLLIGHPFQIVPGWYWTSTAKVGYCSSDNCAWCITTGSAVYYFDKSTPLRVWPVRTGR